MENNVTFNDLVKELTATGLHFRCTDKDWEIYLPHSPAIAVQNVIRVCRNYVMVNWHVVFPEATKNNPQPEIHIYWETQ